MAIDTDEVETKDSIYEAAEAEGVKAAADTEEPAVATEPVVAEEKLELPFPVYDKDGNKVEIDKVTLAALFKGDLQVGYNALGKEQRKTLVDAIRNASQGHWNEHRYTTVQQQLTQTLAKHKELESKHKQFEGEREQWNAALVALIAGDNKPMQRIVDAYQASMTRSGQVPPGYVPQADVEASAEQERQGTEWLHTVGMPAAMEIAQTYAASPKEAYNAILYYIQNEPVLTPQRLEEIIKYDVPMAFEQNGYTATGKKTPAVESNNELSELKKTVEALQARLADKNNNVTETVREKTRKAPPPGSGTTAGAGDSMPSFKSRAQFKAWSAGDADWAKA